MTRFMAATASQSSSGIAIPSALRYAVYLWGIRLSRQQDITAHEEVFVQRCLASVQNAVSTLERRPEAVAYVLQAEILLAYYFFDSNRVVEGQVHTSGAVSIALKYGYHKIVPGQNGAPVSPEVKENIKAWWQVYILEKSWTAALGAPSILVEDGGRSNTVDTPWPGSEV